jgi:hypothetical protein
LFFSSLVIIFSAISASPREIAFSVDWSLATSISQRKIQNHAHAETRGTRRKPNQNQNNGQQPKQHIPINDLFFSSLVIIFSAISASPREIAFYVIGQ